MIYNILSLIKCDLFMFPYFHFNNIIYNIMKKVNIYQMCASIHKYLLL